MVSNFTTPRFQRELIAKGRDVMTFLLCHYLVLIVSLIQEGSETNFNDLGKLLVGGVAVAIACAIAFTFVRLRLRDNKPPTSDFLSISAPQEKKPD
jgi:hypothetical protein